MTNNLFKVPPKTARALSKIPEAIVEAQDPEVERKFCKDFLEQVIEPIEELLWPYADAERLDLGTRKEFPQYALSRHYRFRRRYLLEDLPQLIRIQIYLCASQQQFEIRWQQASDQFFATDPELYAHAREDGTLLDEPVRVVAADNYTIADDGTVHVCNPGDPSCMPGETYPPLADRAPENPKHWTFATRENLKLNGFLGESF